MSRSKKDVEEVVEETATAEPVAELDEAKAAEKAAEDAKANAIVTAFNESVEAELDEDDTKLAMIGVGATFKNVTRLYNQFMIEAGMALSKEDKATHVTESLEGLEFETEEQFDVAAEKLISEEKGINNRSAAALLRAYAKKNDMEVFKKPKSEGAGKTGFASYFYDSLRADPLMTKEAATKLIKDNPSNSENVRKHESHYMNIWELAHDVAVSLTQTEEEAAA